MGEVFHDLQGEIIMDSVTVVALLNLYLITRLILSSLSQYLD